jgi:hypothetical protein
MKNSETTFPPASFVKAKLFTGPIYREDGDLWLTVRGQQDEIRHYFRQIGQELVLDEGEGYAFIRQLELEGDERIPRLKHRSPLSYPATLLLVCLREEFLRFDAAPGDSQRLIKTRDELRNLIVDFLPETTNQVVDVARMDRAIESLQQLGFLRRLNNTEQETYEAMRIIKARLSVTELETVRQRILEHKENIHRHAEPGT